MARLAGLDGDGRGEVGLAGPGRSEEDDVLLRLDEVERSEVTDHVALHAALVGEVELLQGLASREASRADAQLATVRLAGDDLALQARTQELLVGPALLAGSFGEARDRLCHRRGPHGAEQVGELALRRSHTTPRTRS
jgi:hypothetical protein